MMRDDLILAGGCISIFSGVAALANNVPAGDFLTMLGFFLVGFGISRR